MEYFRFDWVVCSISLFVPKCSGSPLVLAVATLLDLLGPWPSHEVASEFVLDGSLGGVLVLIGELLGLAVDTEPRVLDTEQGSAPVGGVPVIVVSGKDAPVGGLIGLSH